MLRNEVENEARTPILPGVATNYHQRLVTFKSEISEDEGTGVVVDLPASPSGPRESF